MQLPWHRAHGVEFVQRTEELKLLVNAGGGLSTSGASTDLKCGIVPDSDIPLARKVSKFTSNDSELGRVPDSLFANE